MSLTVASDRTWAASLTLVKKATSGHAVDGLFGRKEVRGGSLSSLPKWVSVVQKMKRQKSTLVDCALNKPDCPPEARQHWDRIINEAKGLSKAGKIRAVHKYFNAWPYKLDIANYHVNDYWATPMEFMRRSGDCEDYSIAKFYALLQLGFKNDDMRIVAVVDMIRHRGHAVLAVKYKGKTLILDNTTPLVNEDIKFKPLYRASYSVNETTRWLHLPK